MKAWTHWVLCNETHQHYGDNTDHAYAVRAVRTKTGWRLCEKTLAGTKYGQLLTGVKIRGRRSP